MKNIEDVEKRKNDFSIVTERFVGAVVGTTIIFAPPVNPKDLLSFAIAFSWYPGGLHEVQ